LFDTYFPKVSKNIYSHNSLIPTTSPQDQDVRKKNPHDAFARVRARSLCAAAWSPFAYRAQNRPNWFGFYGFFYKTGRFLIKTETGTVAKRFSISFFGLLTGFYRFWKLILFWFLNPCVEDEDEWGKTVSDLWRSEPQVWADQRMG
jgi:hypothetical protein